MFFELNRKLEKYKFLLNKRKLLTLILPKYARYRNTTKRGKKLPQQFINDYYYVG